MGLMADKNLIGIINCCISIDQEATEIYRKLSRLASTKRLCLISSIF